MNDDDAHEPPMPPRDCRDRWEDEADFVCGTFGADIPPDVRARMDADRAAAEADPDGLVRLDDGDE